MSRRQQVARVLRRRAQVGARGGGVVEDGEELALVRRGIDATEGRLQVRGRLAQDLRALAQLGADRSEDVGLLVRDGGEAIRDLPELADRTAQLRDRLGVERRLHPVRDGRDVGGDAARLSRELADVGECGPGPLAGARRQGLIEGLPNVGVGRGRLAGDERRGPFAEQRRRGGDHRRLRGRRHAGVDLEGGLDPIAGRQPDCFHPSHPDAAQHHGVADGQATHRAEPRRIHRFRSTEVGPRQPQRARHHHAEGRDDHHADRELVLPPHDGRPSMNCRTTGSSVCRISSTVPTCRTRPSYNMAMRSPTV